MRDGFLNFKPNSYLTHTDFFILFWFSSLLNKAWHVTIVTFSLVFLNSSSGGEFCVLHNSEPGVSACVIKQKKKKKGRNHNLEKKYQILGQQKCIRVLTGLLKKLFKKAYRV